MPMNGETTLSTIPRVKKPDLPTRQPGASKVDWESIRRTVLESSARLAWGEEASQDYVEKTWAERAAKLAQAIEGEDAGKQTEILVVRFGREVYGLETAYVYDIRPLEHLTRVPRVPQWVAGVVNLRGRIVSALDLPGFLGLPTVKADGEREPAAQYLVVVETPAMEIALVVDEVLQIENLLISRIQEAAGVVRGIRPEYVQGIVVYSDEDNSQRQAGSNYRHSARPALDGNSPVSGPAESGPTLMVLLDLQSLLADKRLIVHEDIL